MVIGHVGVGTPMSRYCASFYMPLFFVISGYLIKTKRPYKEFITGRLKRLMVPYYVFGFIGLALCYIFKKGDIKEYTVNMLFFPADDTMPIVGAIWFLISMFLSECIYYLFLKISKKPLYTLFLCITSCVLLTVIPGIFNIQLPFALNTVGSSCLYLHFGYLIKRRCTKNESKNPLTLSWVLTVVMLAAHLVLCFLNDATNYRQANFGKSILIYLFISMVAIIGYWNLFKKLTHPRILLNYLDFVGRNSMVYLITNQIVIFFVKKVLELFFSSTDTLSTVVSKGICIVSSLAVIHVLVYVLNNKKLKFLIGK